MTKFQSRYKWSTIFAVLVLSLFAAAAAGAIGARTLSKGPAVVDHITLKGTGATGVCADESASEGVSCDVLEVRLKPGMYRMSSDADSAVVIKPTSDAMCAATGTGLSRTRVFNIGKRYVEDGYVQDCTAGAFSVLVFEDDPREVFVVIERLAKP